MNQSCHQCGAQAYPEDQFCGNCGIAQPIALSPAAIAQGKKETDLEPAPARVSTAFEQAPAPVEAIHDQVSSTSINENYIAPVYASPDSPQVEEQSLTAAAEAIRSPEIEFTSDNEDVAQMTPDDLPNASAERQLEREQGSRAIAPNAAPEPDLELQPTIISRPSSIVSSGRQSGNTAGESRTGGGRRTASKMLEEGTVLDSRYEIVRKIGGGGMGAVYLAKDRNLGDAPRAVKEMIQAQMDETQQEKAVGDFRRESLLLTSLEHPSIPTIYDYFFDDQANRFYLVMRYISGGDLLTRLRNAPGSRIDEKTVTAWGMELADVLHYLHSRRPPIIYRDLKPANVMIDGNSGRVMLIDFGIARWVGAAEKGVTAVGTMGYAPPELFSGKAEARSDIYSLGATMFHLLTGSDPQDNPLLIFDFNKHPRPRQLNPALSNEMERILMRAVEYKPEDRFASAAEFRDVLAQHLKDLSANKVSYGTASAERGVLPTMAVEMVFCGFCGGRIAATDLFCAYCGARQPLVGASAALQRPSRVTAKLIVANTTELNASFVLPKESNMVGRSDPNSNIFPEVDLSRFDPNTKISRRHARIWREGDSFLVEDLGSINGTVVNEAVRLAPRQPRVLESGDRLRLGETTLHFLVG